MNEEPLKRLPKAEPPPKARTQTPVPRAKVSRAQTFILVGLILSVVCVLGALVVSVIVNRDQLFGTSPVEQAMAESTPSSTPSPRPTPTITPTPTVTSTPGPPTATPTLVVPPELLNRDIIDEITGYVVSIRGLEPLQDVPSHFLTRAQLRQRLNTEYTEAVVSAALDRNRELYVAIDLLEPTADFGTIVIDSAAQNIGGFYTPDDQVLYLVAESVNMFASEEIVYAHEYAHALQDQHFDLTRFMDEDINADQAIAARALVEGDATW